MLVVVSAVAAEEAAAPFDAEVVATKVTTAERRAAVEVTEQPVKKAGGEADVSQMLSAMPYAVSMSVL